MNWKNTINPETLRVVDANKIETKTSFTVHLNVIFGGELVVRFQVVFAHPFPILTVNCGTNSQFQIPYDHIGSLIRARTPCLNLPNNHRVLTFNPRHPQGTGISHAPNCTELPWRTCQPTETTSGKKGRNKVAQTTRSAQITTILPHPIVKGVISLLSFLLRHLYASCSSRLFRSLTTMSFIAGGQSFHIFSVDERSQVDNTTPVRQRRVTGLAFQGAGPFGVEGSGF
jgi:hypothetical protein